MKRFLSPVWFLVVAAAFTLPFITVSCQAPPGLGDLGGELGGQVPTEGFEIKATGLDLVLGNEPEVQADPQFGDLTQGQEDTEPSLFAMIAFGAAVLGIFLSLLRNRIGGVLTLILGALALLTLFLLRNDVSGALPAEAAGFLTIRYEIGYWLALVFSLVALGWGIMRVMSRPEGAVAAPMAGAPMDAPPAPTPAPPTSGDTGFERPAAPTAPERRVEPDQPPAGMAGPPAGSETGGPETAGPPPATPPGVDGPGSPAREDEPPPPPA